MVNTGLFAFGYILLFVSNTLSSSAGVGGGLLNVAIIHSVQGYDLQSSVVLSLSAIMGNTLLQMLINFRSRHPNCFKRMAIYWDMIAVMLPAELAGSNLGVIFSSVMPATILYVCAIIVLMIGGMFSAKKAFHLYELENERCAERAAATDTKNPIMDGGDVNDSNAKLLPESSFFVEEVGLARSVSREGRERNGSGASLTGPGTVDISDDFVADPSAPLPPLELPWVIIGVVLSVWVCYLVLYIVMATLPGCSASWGIALSFIYIILLIEAPVLFRHLTQQQASHPEIVVAGDIYWGPASFPIPMVTFSIGVLTALLGFGGGELIGPYLLHLKVQPLVSTATSGMISFLNTTLSLIHYAILGKVKYDQSALLFALGAVAGLCGRMCSLFVVARFDRASILVFALVAVLGFSWIVYILYIAMGDVDFTLKDVC